jgi:hypothetical protein
MDEYLGGEGTNPMANKNQKPHVEWLQRAKDLLNKGGIPSTWRGLARAMGVDVGTLQQSFLREFNIRHVSEIIDKEAPEPPPTDFGTFEDQSTNEWVITQNGPLVYTLDQLLKACKVDLKVWQVHNHVVNQWQVAMKVKNGDKEHVETVPLYQVKAWLIRKQLQAVFPVINPITISDDLKLPEPKISRAAVKRALIVADPQVGFRRRMHTSELVPFHDRRVLDIALQIAKADWADAIYFIGDCLDLSMWSTKYTPEPEFYWTTMPALIEWSWWLTQFRLAAPDAVINQHEGNHDKRMPDAILAYMKEAYQLKAVNELELPPALSIPKLLALHDLKVNYIENYPDDAFWINQNVVVEHGNTVRGGAGDTAKAVVSKTTYTTIFGHIHRREMVSRRIATRDGFANQTAFCPGCACHVDGRVPGSSMKDNWQQGLAVIEFTDDAENIIPIAVNDGVAVYDGKVYKAREVDKKIDKMLMERLGAANGKSI